MHDFFNLFAVAIRSLFTGGDALERLEEQLVGMLWLDARSVELAHRGVARRRGRGPVAAAGVRDRPRGQPPRPGGPQADHRHASVQERVADLPVLLTYMSIVKDIERVGDYAKNVLDIARVRARTGSPSADELQDLRPTSEALARITTEVIEVLQQQDVDRAHELLSAAETELAGFDAAVEALVVSDAPAHEAVPRALYHRYAKRIVAHLHNVLTSLVAPLDQLDFYREP